MSSIFGDTVSKRKKCLAELDKDHLLALGHDAKLTENRTNSAGHTDQIVVESQMPAFVLQTTKKVIRAFSQIRVTLPLAGTLKTREQLSCLFNQQKLKGSLR